MTCTLQAPRAIDYLAIASWIADAAACARWAGARVPFPFSAPELSRLLAIDGSESYCLLDETSTACAFGQFWVATPGTVHLGRIIVAPSKRGTGYGRMLCRQLIEKAVRRTGAGTISLRVYRDNAVALALYVDLGFVVDSSQSSTEVLFMQAAAQPISASPDRA